jgi:hypothetical protein
MKRACARAFGPACAAVLCAAGLLSTGCATSRSALVCFAPARPLEYQSAPRLRDRFILLTRHDLGDDDFTCYPTDDGLICWVVLHDAGKVPIVKAALNSNPGFRLLSVGYFRPEDADLFAMMREERSVSPATGRVVP